MRKTVRVLTVLLILTGTSLSAQTPQSQQRPRVEEQALRGKIVIPDRHDYDRRIEVKLQKSSQQVIQTAYTDASGNFEFRGLGPGSYYVVVNVEGYEPVNQLVEVFSSFGSSNITILLNRPAIEFRTKPTGIDAADPDVVDVAQMKENFPKKAVQNYDKAIQEKEKGKFESAVKLLEEAVKIAPTFFHAHNNLGIIYQSLKRYEDAEKEYRISNQLNSKTDRPLTNLGSLYIEQAGLQKTAETKGGFLDKALDALEEAVKLNPRSAVGYFLLGQANYRSNFMEEAEVAFKKAQSIDAKLAPAHLMLANVYVKLEKWQDAMQILDAYLKENPKAADRASVEQMRERIAQAMQAAR